MSLYTPGVCSRERNDCYALATIKSTCGGSFVCCGHNTAENRSWPADVFRFCWKNKEVDEMGDYDHSDIKDSISVMAQALSADEHIARDKEDKD